MEAITDINDAVGGLEVDHLKFKEMEHLEEQTQSYNVMEVSAPATIEHISSVCYTELNSELFVGQSAYFGSKPHFEHEALYTKPSKDPITELTLRNFKRPYLSADDQTDSDKDLQLRKGLEEGTGKLVLRPKYLLHEDSSNEIDTGIPFLPQTNTQKLYLSSQFDQNLSQLCDCSTQNEKYIASGNADMHCTSPSQANGLDDTGSQLFSVMNALKRKDIELSCHDDNKFHKCAYKSGQFTHFKADSASPSATINNKLSGIPTKGISIRSFLKPKNKLTEVEKLHIFKLIVDLVSNLHSQGFILKHLRPSHFIIFPTKQVKYVGPLIDKGQRESLFAKTELDGDCLENTWKRRRSILGKRNAAEASTKKLVFSRHSGVLKEELSKDFDKQSSNVESCCEICDRLLVNVSRMLQTSLVILGLSSGGQNTISEVLKLEERWYVSPEELNEGLYSSSSNVYSLGVLLFELFCHFESREVHFAAMLNLRHRILPPNFLSKQPKESGICLWMLHPDPSSRPKTRDILNCNVFCKDRELSAAEQLSSTIDYEHSEADLLLHFLSTLRKHKELQIDKLMENLGSIEEDIRDTKKRHFSNEHTSRDIFLQENSTGMSDFYACKEPLPQDLGSEFSVVNTDARTLMNNFESIESAYFSMRSKSSEIDIGLALRQDINILKAPNELYTFGNNTKLSYMKDDSSNQRGLFFEGLCKYACYKKFVVRGSLRNPDILNSANVICSLSFDKNEEYFAAAGASKKIKVFEFDAFQNYTLDINYPVLEMSSKSKLSCLCWNRYIRNYLASTDYDGVVQLWDASTGQGFHQYTDHEKRAWCVDFSSEAPTKLASGSDDCSVKLWSIHEKECIKTIKSVANVCCVQFSPYSSNLLAFGSADYGIYCYDIRNTRIPWCTLAGHRRTVSYIKFVNSNTIVSASTDNTLKLWDLKKTVAAGLSTNACTLTMTGHSNEKNFVGLSVCDGYILCGSETNEVYAYHKKFPMPITSYKFGNFDPITGHEIGGDSTHFVSSICWRRTSNMVLAANSSGCIRLLQMV
ncbi:protein SUPPRESSOR OF PHYA-105 1-like isoform X1 [Zingiber officinale]|uniref:protein SUPPRESSOR OF PHYA-105 1-like isoform X1 n=1 Tax=Zingiber officinale TaxID=94328 RepID=UPI001C4B6E96|nr:protein SUPPRESSOR OF PHYA-105 1-like isoform X1 [Zingiber officinale]XP_042382304.1 protein SUPPRESSOR OF PHYA-105 1-like isoform X1 [Zingiber officinale]